MAFMPAGRIGIGRDGENESGLKMVASAKLRAQGKSVTTRDPKTLLHQNSCASRQERLVQCELYSKAARAGRRSTGSFLSSSFVRNTIGRRHVAALAWPRREHSATCRPITAKPVMMGRCSVMVDIQETGPDTISSGH